MSWIQDTPIWSMPRKCSGHNWLPVEAGCLNTFLMPTLMDWNTNGDIYEGEWRKGVQHGYGLMYYHTYQTRYHGGFAMGKKHGQGTYTW